MDGRGQIIQVPQPRNQAGFLGSISSVKINGVAVPPRAIYEHSGPAELVLEGENLTPDTLKLYHNGVLYTPLKSSDTYAYYLLGDNGTNKVMLNGKNFTTIIVKDVVVPEGFPVEMRMAQKSNDDRFWTPAVQQNPTEFKMVNCINYPFKATETYPNFMIQVRYSQYDAAELGLENCTLNASEVTDTVFNLNVKPIDVTQPAYLTYKGFIFAVFNYSA